MSDHLIQMQKIRREQIRWFLLTALNIARPVGMYTEALLPIVQATYPDSTHQEVRRELDYLHDRKLVSIERDGMDRWFAQLDRIGVDLVEYTIPCEAGIARPRITA